MHTQLSKALNLAVKRGHLVRNIGASVPKPAAPQSSPRPFNQPELGNIWDTALAHPERVRWTLHLMTGCRQSERLALAWDDIRLENNTVIISRSMRRLTWLHGCGDAKDLDHTPAECPSKYRPARFGSTSQWSPSTVAWGSFRAPLADLGNSAETRPSGRSCHPRPRRPQPHPSRHH